MLEVAWSSVANYSSLSYLLRLCGARYLWQWQGNSRGWDSGPNKLRWARSYSLGFYNRWQNHHASSSNGHTTCQRLMRPRQLYSKLLVHREGRGISALAVSPAISASAFIKTEVKTEAKEHD